MSVFKRDIETAYLDFPILHQQVNDRALVYLDNAATTHQPKQVVSAMVDFINNDYANTHGRIHTLSERSQDRLNLGRAKVAAFIGVKDVDEVCFSYSATYGLNLVAQAYFANRLTADDIVLVSEMEHHSNFLPWQRVCEQTGAKLEIVPMLNDALDLDWLEQKLAQKPAVLAISHVSNVLGLANPLAEIIRMAHKNGTLVVVDGAQAVGHVEVDVVKLDCDFYVFSGHKMYAPTGVGVVYAKKIHWQQMSPWVVGGGMVEKVSLDGSTFFSGIEGFEAGTKNIIGVVGLSAAIDYIENFGVEQIHKHEIELAAYLYDNLSKDTRLKILGGSNRSALVSFVMDKIHPHDLVMLLDQQGVACRGGHHCAQPLLKHYGITSSTRVSCAMYTTKQDIDKFLTSLSIVCEMLDV